MPFQDGNWSLMAFPDRCLWRQSLHRHIFCILVHADDWILLHYEKGLDKPLTHVKMDCGLGFLGSGPALWTRITSRTSRSILSAATMIAKCITTVLAAFSPPVSVLVSTSKPTIPCNFISQKVPFLLALHCLPFISTSLPSEMRLLQLVLWSSPCVSLGPLIVQLSISPLLHLSGFWDQLLKSALHFSPQALQYPPAQLLWIIFSNAALEHHIALFA